MTVEVVLGHLAQHHPLFTRTLHTTAYTLLLLHLKVKLFKYGWAKITLKAVLDNGKLAVRNDPFVVSRFKAVVYPLEDVGNRIVLRDCSTA